MSAHSRTAYKLFAAVALSLLAIVSAVLMSLPSQTGSNDAMANDRHSPIKTPADKLELEIGPSVDNEDRGVSERDEATPDVPSSVEQAYEHRHEIAELPSNINDEQKRALRQLLAMKEKSEFFRNTVANKLRQSGEENLVADLTEMAWDKTETPKWRNYCVQHLYTCYEHAEKPDPSIIDTLFTAADPAQSDEKLVRICAVWSLARAATLRDESKRPSADTIERIGEVAIDALREKDAHFLITTAGVQSCARLGLTDALPDIRKLAGDESTEPLHLRVVAVAALGDLGNADDLALLEALGSSKTSRLAKAAAHALKKIHERSSQF